MTHITGHDRSQTLLLPESLDDYVGPENPVRFIEAFVDGLDLAAAGFARVQPKETGRPGYAPVRSVPGPLWRQLPLTPCTITSVMPVVDASSTSSGSSLWIVRRA